MSYSYIKSVYPNFKTTQQKLYTIEDDFKQLIDNNKISNPELINQIKYNYVNTTPNLSTNSIIKEQGVPYSMSKLPYNLEGVIKETFEQNSEKNNIIDNIENNSNSHNDIVSHVLKCTKCKDMILKQLNIEIDNKRREETMELISYLIFGIFILLLIEILKK